MVGDRVARRRPGGDLVDTPLTASPRWPRGSARAHAPRSARGARNARPRAPMRARRVGVGHEQSQRLDELVGVSEPQATAESLACSSNTGEWALTSAGVAVSHDSASTAPKLSICDGCTKTLAPAIASYFSSSSTTPRSMTCRCEAGSVATTPEPISAKGGARDLVQRLRVEIEEPSEALRLLAPSRVEEVAGGDAPPGAETRRVGGSRGFVEAEPAERRARGRGHPSGSAAPRPARWRCSPRTPSSSR